MDRVIELIIVFYLISSFLRFLRRGQQGKDRHYPPPQHRPMPPQRPGLPPSPHRYPGPPSSTGRPKETTPRPVLTSREREALDVLADWERKARTHGGGTAGPAAPPGRIATSPGKLPGVSPREVEGLRTSQRPVKRPVPMSAPAPVPEMRTAPSPAAEVFSRKAAREAISVGQGAMPGELRPQLSARPEVSGGKIAAEGISFLSHPDMLWQGIIMSEILRPPLARRNPVQLPYLRG